MGQNEAALASLPFDAVEFLRTGHGLDYPPESCDFDEVILRSIKDLRIDELRVVGPEDDEEPPYAGYLIRVIDLVATVEDDVVYGLLGWLVDDEVFCTYDSGHEVLVTFPGAAWSDIQQNAGPYLNGQWDEDRNEFEPWNHGHKPSDDGEGYVGQIPGDPLDLLRRLDPTPNESDLQRLEEATGFARKLRALARAGRQDDVDAAYGRLDGEPLSIEEVGVDEAADLVEEYLADMDVDVDIEGDNPTEHDFGWEFATAGDGGRAIILDRFTGAVWNIGAGNRDWVGAYRATGNPQLDP